MINRVATGPPRISTVCPIVNEPSRQVRARKLMWRGHAWHLHGRTHVPEMFVSFSSADIGFIGAAPSPGPPRASAI
eukprot:1551438-Pyramimonas_sp.AAC.1